MIQQIGMRRQGALTTKVLDGFDEPLAKEDFPDPVYGNSGDQGMIAAEHPLNQLQTIPRRYRSGI